MVNRTVNHLILSCSTLQDATGTARQPHAVLGEAAFSGCARAVAPDFDLGADVFKVQTGLVKALSDRTNPTRRSYETPPELVCSKKGLKTGEVNFQNGLKHPGRKSCFYFLGGDEDQVKTSHTLQSDRISLTSSEAIDMRRPLRWKLVLAQAPPQQSLGLQPGDARGT